MESCSDISLKSDSEMYVSCAEAQADCLGISSGTSSVLLEEIDDK